MNIHWKDWYWSWNCNTLATWCEELTHLKRPRCWERLKAGGVGADRGWDDWMASLTQWTWVWVSSGSWWWTGRACMLQSIGSQRVGHDQGIELNWTDLPNSLFPSILLHLLIRIILEERALPSFSFIWLFNYLYQHRLVTFILFCSITIIILLLKLSQIGHLLPVSFQYICIIFWAFLTLFWHHKMVQVYLWIFFTCPGISLFSKKPWFLLLDNVI